MIDICLCLLLPRESIVFGCGEATVVAPVVSLLLALRQDQGRKRRCAGFPSLVKDGLELTATWSYSAAKIEYSILDAHNFTTVSTRSHNLFLDARFLVLFLTIRPLQAFVPCQ